MQTYILIYYSFRRPTTDFLDNCPYKSQLQRYMHAHPNLISDKTMESWCKGDSHANLPRVTLYRPVVRVICVCVCYALVYLRNVLLFAQPRKVPSPHQVKLYIFSKASSLSPKYCFYNDKSRFYLVILFLPRKYHLLT